MRKNLLAALTAVTVILAACKPAEPTPTPTPTPTPEVTAPAAPTMLTATPGAGFVRLLWRDGSETEEGFIIGRVELADPSTPFTAGELVEVARASTDQVIYRDAPPLGRAYGYGVAAFNAAGRSDFVVLTEGLAPLGATGATCQVAVPSLEDPDGDGLSSELELAGWTVRLNQNGQMQFTETTVASSVTAGDADDDGLCDGEERLLRTNPNKKDSDGDGLSDSDEVLVWGSSPINVDSDGDAQGNTAFYDGSELTRFATSPTLADTDGDGRTDFEEINQNSTNALVADLPQPKLELVGTVDVSLNVELSNGTVQTDAVTQAMTRGMETSTNRTSSTATTVTSEVSVEATATVSAGFPDGVSASVSATYGQTDGFMSESSTSFEQSGTESAREAYEGATTRELSQGQTIVDGKLAVQFNITNAGTRTFELKDLVVTALTRDRDNPASVGSVATLHLPTQSVTLGEGQAAGPFRVEATVPANVALDLLANPSALYFKPASFQLIDRTGTNFAFSVGEATANRTALVVIDYGGDRPLETYRVATNVARVGGGQVAGLKMKDAMKAIGLMPGTGYEAQANPRRVKKLTKVREVAAQQRGVGTSKFWALIAAENALAPTPVSTRLLSDTTDFDELVLMPRDRVYLAYVADEDGDGLFSREERLYHTSDQVTDTDGDGLSDLQEIREGWDVFSTLPHYSTRPHVYSNPASADADRDTLSDAQERNLGTDPNRSDTDADGLRDDVDPDPRHGVGRPLVVAAGNLAAMFVNDVVTDAAGNVVVLGGGGADVDGDALLSNAFNRSCWLQAFDATGRRKWAHELELMSPNPFGTLQRDLVMDARGHVYFFENLYPGAFPGLMTGGFQLVELDADGVLVSAVPVAVNGDFRPERLARSAAGDFAVMGNGNAGVMRAYVFDATGAVVGSKSWPVPVNSASPPQPWTLVLQGTAAGFVFEARGCELWTYDRTLTTQTTLSLCAQMPTAYPVVVGDSGEAWAVNQLTTRKFNAAGVVQWSNPRTGAFNQVTSMTVDRAGRVFLTAMDATSHSQAIQIDAAGVTGFEVTVPGSASFFASAVDANGNFVIGGQMTDGLNGRVVQRGPSDVVVVRNPQLLFQ